jgi:hypothetical protein
MTTSRMPNSDRTYSTAYEKAARIADLLLRLERSLTTREVAVEVGLSCQGAWSLMQDIARVTPVIQDEFLKWRKFDGCHQLPVDGSVLE